MKLLQYLKDHKIISIGTLVDDKCVIAEVIVDDPWELVKQVIESNCYISEMRWWDRASFSKKSQIGYGGTRDPRDPQSFYFAETDICSSFKETTTADEYIDYLNTIKSRYSQYDLYAAFDIYRK